MILETFWCNIRLMPKIELTQSCKVIQIYYTIWHIYICIFVFLVNFMRNGCVTPYMNSNSNSNYFISLKEYGNHVIHHLSYNIVNNFSIIEQIGDPSTMIYHRYRRATTMSIHRQVSNISRTKSQHLKDSRTVLRPSLPNPLKPEVRSRMKM